MKLEGCTPVTIQDTANSDNGMTLNSIFIYSIYSISKPLWAFLWPRRGEALYRCSTKPGAHVLLITCAYMDVPHNFTALRWEKRHSRGECQQSSSITMLFFSNPVILYNWIWQGTTCLLMWCHQASGTARCSFLCFFSFCTITVGTRTPSKNLHNDIIIFGKVTTLLWT